jgi:Uma2 family endonuclease
MAGLPRSRMDVDALLAWSATIPGLHELVDGEVFAVAPERAGHGRVKFAVQAALNRGLRRLSLLREMLPDGMTIGVDAHTAYEPDTLVYCGPRIDPDAVEAPPAIVVEALSPGTQSVDAGTQLAGYFLLPSVVQCLLRDPRNPRSACAIRHRRTGATIETRIVSEGSLPLDPPGIALAVGDLFGERRPACYDAQHRRFGAMRPFPQTRISVDEYLAWSEANPGRYELVQGEVYAMTPERVLHA